MPCGLAVEGSPCARCWPCAVRLKSCQPWHSPHRGAAFRHEPPPRPCGGRSRPTVTGSAQRSQCSDSCVAHQRSRREPKGRALDIEPDRRSGQPRRRHRPRHKPTFPGPECKTALTGSAVCFLRILWLRGRDFAFGNGPAERLDTRVATAAASRPRSCCHLTSNSLPSHVTWRRVACQLKSVDDLPPSRLRPRS
jgi:hypothetical protein